MKWIYPPSLNTGDVLSKYHLDSYRLNDEYFNAVADAWRPIWAGKDNYLWTTPVTVFSGYHLLRSDAKTLVYWLYSNGSDVTHKLYYDSVQVAQVSGTNTASGTYSLSAKSPGIYYVESKLTGTSGSGGLRAPFTRYTGSKSYQTPNTIADGNVSALADFTKLGDNDLYFRDVVHPSPAFSGIEGYLPGTETSRDIWVGYDRFHPDHYRMQYNLDFTKTGGDSNYKVSILYDVGGGNQQAKVISTAGSHIGYWDLSSPGNYTKGNYYKVAVRLSRPAADQSVAANVNYLMMSAPALDASYTVQDQHAAGQYVYGNTGGQDSRLSLFKDNDAAIRDRLIWADETNARQDYTVTVPYYEDTVITFTGKLRASRRFNLLYYRVQDAEIQWGTEPETQRLEDYDGSNPYRILDLESLGVQIGQVYTITGNGLHFAMEIP